MQRGGFDIMTRGHLCGRHVRHDRRWKGAGWRTAELLRAGTQAMKAFDYELARNNMVEQQIRPWEVRDQRVLDLLFKVKREDFVPPAYRALAFADLELPLSEHARMWTPKMEARVMQELALAGSDRVLEIGT